MPSGNGGGPGGHPGVTLVPLTGDLDNDKAVLEPEFEAGKELEAVYTAGGNTIALFVKGYKK